LPAKKGIAIPCEGFKAPKRKVSHPMQRSKSNEEKGSEVRRIPAEAIPENVDQMVSGFLQEIANISSDIKQMPQPKSIEEVSAVNPKKNETAPLPITIIDESRPEPSQGHEEIDLEIQDSLGELERLKTKVVPVTDRKDPKSTRSTPLPIGAPEIPATPAAAEEKIDPKQQRPNADSDDQTWQKLEIFRSQVVSRRQYARVKYVLLALILIALLGICSYYFFFKSKPTRIMPAADTTTSAPPVVDQAAYSEPVISTDIIKAECIRNVPPVYPQSAKRYGITGTVVLEVQINEKGDVVNAKAVSGPGLFREAAEEALMQWKFKPALANGVSIASNERISINFKPLN
jgi:TonB family protein